MFPIQDPKHPFARIFYSTAALGPAIAFAILWKCLNANFLPYIGEGADGNGTAFLAGLAFWWWSYSSIAKVFQKEPSEAAVRFQAKRIYWQLAVSIISIPAGRILFSIVPPWSNSMGAVLGAMLGYMTLEWINPNKNSRFVHDRGTIIQTEEQARKRIMALPAGEEPRIKWVGIDDAPAQIAEQNLLTAGNIGTGKTRIHRELMRSVVPSIRPGSDRRALIYDVKCDLLSELSTMNPVSEVIVFNPFDKRSVAWDVASDVKTPDQAAHFVEALILPEKEGRNAFFTDGARAIVAGVIDSLNGTHLRRWDLRHLVLLTATLPRLERVLSGSDLIDQYFSPPETFANIRNTIANIMVKLKPVAALWKHADRKISLKQWVERGDSILVLAGKENLQASLEPINRIAFKMISTDFSSERESPRRTRLWFFCDELKTAGRLDSLPALLNARSKGVRCVLGFQDIEGLVEAYHSKETPKEILNRCSTVTWLKLTSTDTAEWAAKRAGELERFEYMETLSKDGSTSSGEHLAKRDAYLPSQFLNLPDFTANRAHGIHSIKGAGGIFQSGAHYEFRKSDVLDFDPRPDSEQLLEPWGPADDEWLDGGQGKPPTDPKPNEPDLGSLGRIDF